MEIKIIKKIFTLIFFGIISFSSLYAGNRIVTFDAGLATGIPLYGDEKIQEENRVLTDGGQRVFVGTVADVNFRICNGLTFFLGNDTNFDFVWKNKNFFNHIETSFFPGLKFYPGVGGLNLSLAYSVGCRWDFSSDTSVLFDDALWGNGFRLGLEYNFSYDSNPYLPSVGFYYRLCPRGNNFWDNIFSVYCVENF